MEIESRGQLNQIQEALSKNGHETTLRFLLSCLGGTPYVGGGFSGAAGLWSEKRQDLINKMILEYLNINEERIETLDKSIVQRKDHQTHVAGYIKFNPNTTEIIDASGISSITDNGTHDFSINHSEPLDDYVFNYYGSGPVILKRAIQEKNHIHIEFESPCPELVTLVFYKI